MFCMDCRRQFQLLQEHRVHELMLPSMLEAMCNTLAMGIEEYIRSFDAARGLQEFSELGQRFIHENGDAATLLLRATAASRPATR